MSLDIIARGMAASADNKAADAQNKADLAVNMISNFPTGLKYKGSCTYAQLPATASVGDAWTVTDRDNMEYAWDGTNWIPIGIKVDQEFDPTSTNAQSGTAVSQAVNPILQYITYSISNNEATISHCSTSIQGSYEVPSMIEGYPVAKIFGSSFRNCTGLTGITLPASISSIYSKVFQNCSNLQFVKILGPVSSIQGYMFDNCTSLKSIEIPKSVTFIDTHAFFNCTGLASITLPDSVTSIGSYAFSGCSGLTSVTIGNSVTSIGNYAFQYCTGLKSVTIPDSVTSIGQQAFIGCNSIQTIYYGGTEEQWNELSNHPWVVSGGHIYYNQKTAVKQDIYDYHDDTKQPLTDIENGEGDYSLQQKTDTENQPLALGKWSMAEGRGQNFTSAIIDKLVPDGGFHALDVLDDSSTDNIFYYRPTTSGLAPRKSYSMSLVWDNAGRTFSYGASGTFCIYAYNGGSWVPINVNSYTQSFKINSIPLKNNATYYNMTFTTDDVPELREIVFAFGALSSKTLGFNTGKWTLYRLDEDVWTDISDRCPDFSTVQFRGASDAAMDDWFTNYAGTDRGMIWRRNSRSNLSSIETQDNNNWFYNNIIVGGSADVSKIRENAVLWFPISEGSLSNTQGAYFYVKNASKSYPAFLELDDYERQIKDGDGTIIRHQSIYESVIGSQIFVYMGLVASSASHTEGNFNNAVWLNSDTRLNELNVQRQHAEGSRNLVTGYASTVSGEYNQGIGNQTDVGGSHNIARYNYQTVRGYHNDNKEGNLFEIGNGNENTKQNAFEVHSDGTAKVQVQGNTDDSVAQKGYVDSIAETKADADKFVTLTQDQYDALTTKDPNTYYYIIEE